MTRVRAFLRRLWEDHRATIAFLVLALAVSYALKQNRDHSDDVAKSARVEAVQRAAAVDHAVGCIRAKVHRAVDNLATTPPGASSEVVRANLVRDLDRISECKSHPPLPTTTTGRSP